MNVLCRINPTLMSNITKCITYSFQIDKTYTSSNKPRNLSNKNRKKVRSSDIISKNVQLQEKYLKRQQDEKQVTSDAQITDAKLKTPELKRKNPLQRHHKQLEQFLKMDEKGKINLITQYKEKQMFKQLCLIAKQMCYLNQKSDLIWAALQEVFINSLKPTTDPVTIRNYSVLIYCLAKAKRATRNYQTPLALVLPYSSSKSFTQIVTSISRMGGMSQQFCHIVQKIYYKKKQQLTALEMNLINFSLVKNGKKLDPTLIEQLNSFPLRGICIMLKSYDRCNQLTADILKKCIPAILARKQETNFFDLKHLINIYTKHMYLDDQRIVKYFDQQYRVIAQNVSEQSMEQIWQYIPQAMNENKLPISFMQNLIKSLKILRSRRKISQRTWKKISQSFNKFKNLQIRTKLEKIY